MIDLATSEDETEASIQDTNLVASPPKGKEAYKTQHSPTRHSTTPPDTAHTRTGKQQARETSESVRPVSCIKNSFSGLHNIQPHNPYHGLPLQALAACKDENIRKMIDHNYWTKGLI